MPFFGAGGLGGASDPASSLDPKLVQALMAQFPGLQQMGQQRPQQSDALAGYQFPGVQFFSGQGTPSSLGNLSPFEGAKGFGSESITAGLALGNYGKSGSQATPPGGAQPFSLGQMNLPSLQLPQQVAAQQGGGTDMSPMSAPTSGETTGGTTINVGDMLGTANKAMDTLGLDLFGAGDLGQQSTEPGLPVQRAGEREDFTSSAGRDLSTLGGSFLPSAQGAFPNVQPMATGQPGFGADTTFSMGNQTPPLSPGGFQSDSFSMPGTGETMMAPGGASAQDVLGTTGQPTDWGGLGSSVLGGLGGALGIYSGVQSAQEGDALGAAAGIGGGALAGYGALQSLSQSFPEIFGGNTLPKASEMAFSAISTVAPETAAAIKEAMGGLTSSGQTIGGLSGADYSSLVGLALAAASPFVKQDPENQRIMAMASQAITLASMMLNQSGYGAAVAAAVNSAMEIYAGISNPDQSAGETTTKAILAALPLVGTAGGDIGDLLYDRPWDHFGSRINDTREKATGSLGLLEAGLPYVQTKEELGQLVNQYQNHLSTTTDWGGQGFAGTDPYQLGSLPQAGGNKHELGQKYDFGPQLNHSQNMINELLGILPGTAITGGYGDPGSSLMGDTEAYRRLWQQNVVNQGTMPGVMQGPSQQVMTNPGGWVDQSFHQPAYGDSGPMSAIYQGAGNAPTFGSAQDIAGGQAQGNIGYQPQWDPATGNTYYGSADGGAMAPPRSSDYFQKSPYYQQAQMAMYGRTPQGMQQQQYTRALQDYMTQLQGLQGNLGQLNTSGQQMSTAGMDPAVLAALGMGQPQGAPGFGVSPGGNGGGIDLQALLKQMGYAA